jgi:thioester reductase-like protein
LLGTFILNELLQKTDSIIYCLVRDSSVEAAYERLARSLRSYKLPAVINKDRVHILLGDLSKPKFGLKEEEYNSLANEIHSIYHCGARLSFIDPYRNLKRINVQGTRSVIEFACCMRTKHINHVSSIAVYDTENYEGVAYADEDLPLEDSWGFHSGYDESKWVSEMIVTEAGRRGIPITIYRPGNISGDSRTGLCSATDLVGIMIKGCIDLGAAPDNSAFVDVVPIDYVSRALVHLSLQPDSIGQKFNLVNSTPARWIDLIKLLNEIGYKIDMVPFDEWCNRIRAASKQKQDNPLIGLLPLFEGRTLFSNRCYSGSKAEKELKDTDINCHPMNKHLVALYIQHLVEQSAIPPIN